MGTACEREVRCWIVSAHFQAPRAGTSTLTGRPEFSDRPIVQPYFAASFSTKAT